LQELRDQLKSLRIEREHQPRRAWKWVLVVLLLLVIGAGALYYVRGNPNFRAVEIQTAQAAVIQRGGSDPGTPILTASGYVVARRKAVVSAKIQGRLSELHVEEGSRVREGEVIARLESTDYLAQIERAKAAVVRAEADLSEFRRQAKIAGQLATAQVQSVDQRDAADSRVLQAEAALIQSKAELGVQEAFYQNTFIRAPFSGVVVKKMAEVGESVAPIPPGVNISTASGAIVALADLATLEVEVDVNEANVAQLDDDQPAEVVVQAFPGKTYKGVLRQVIPTADRTKATVMVKVTILEKDKDLKPEMSANVTFLEAPKKGVVKDAPPERIVTVPKNTVVQREGRKIVFEVENGKAAERPVETGSDMQDRVIVKKGLIGSETLVSSPPATLRDGDNVKVKG
jgi:RND family efflux transporter MFP subunit